MNSRWQYEFILKEEEKKISRLLDSLCKDTIESVVKDTNEGKFNIQSLAPFPSASSTYQQSVGTQVDEDELEIIGDDDLQAFVSQKALDRWDSILEEQIRTDAKSHVNKAKEKMVAQKKVIKDLRASVIKLLQWKNSTLNHFTLLTETFLVRMKSKVSVSDNVSMDILDEMVNLFANLEADLTEPIKLPKSIDKLQHSHIVNEDDEDQEDSDILMNNKHHGDLEHSNDLLDLSQSMTISSKVVSYSAQSSNSNQPLGITNIIPFQPKQRQTSTEQAKPDQSISTFGKLFQTIEDSEFTINETLSKPIQQPPPPPPPPPTVSESNIVRSAPKKTKRLSVHLLASPVSENAVISLAARSDKKSRRLSVHLLSNDRNSDASNNNEEAVIIEEYVCMECRKNKDMPSILKPGLHDAVHVLEKDNEDQVGYLFDLLARVQACSNNNFQDHIMPRRTADAGWIGKRTFLLFLLAFELFDNPVLTLDLASSIYDKGLQEASKRSLKMRTKLHFNDFVDTLSFLSDVIQDGPSRIARLNSLIRNISSRIQDLVKNPEFSFKFFSIFWEIGDDRLYNLLHYYRDSLFSLYQKSKHYGINKNKMKLSEAQLVGSGFSAFEIFFINNDIVPEKIPSSAVRRIVQFVRPMYIKEGMSYVLGCLFYSTIYMAKFQKVHYKRASSSNKNIDKNIQEESWRILEDLLVRIHKDT